LLLRRGLPPFILAGKGVTMRKRIVLVRHSDEAADDLVFTYLRQNGYEPVLHRPYAGEALEVDDGVAGGGRADRFQARAEPSGRET
jgi:hypothetical protein